MSLLSMNSSAGANMMAALIPLLPDDGNKLIAQAGEPDHLDIIRGLIRIGINVNYKDENGLTGLENALWYGQMDNVVTLLEEGASVEVALFVKVVMGRLPTLFSNFTSESDKKENSDKKEMEKENSNKQKAEYSTSVLAAKHLVCAGTSVSTKIAHEFSQYVSELNSLAASYKPDDICTERGVMQLFFGSAAIHAFTHVKIIPTNPFIAFQKTPTVQKDQRQLQVCNAAKDALLELSQLSEKVKAIKQFAFAGPLTSLPNDIYEIIMGYVERIYVPLRMVEEVQK